MFFSTIPINSSLVPEARILLFFIDTERISASNQGWCSLRAFLHNLKSAMISLQVYFVNGFRQDPQLSGIYASCVHLGIYCLLGIPLLGLAGCSTLDRFGSDPVSEPNQPSEIASSGEIQTDAEDPIDQLVLLSAPLDDLVLPPEIVDFPVGPDNLPTLKALEELCTSALGLTADGDLEPARDHLFTLQDQLERPMPATVDSLYASHRASLGRRLCDP